MATRHSNGRSAAGTRRRAVGYIRMSSSKQESSPEQQRREIIELAKKKGYEIVGWYADEGISGDEIEKRPDFCRMLEDGKAGKFDIMLCWDQDRFGRFDSLKAGYVIEPLRMAGVRLVTVLQGEIDWNDFAGRMMYAIQQEGKNQFLHSLSANVLRGRIQRAREGHGIAMAPYGCDRVFYDEAGRLVHRVPGNQSFIKPKNWKASLDISEDTAAAELVRELFDRYANTDANLRTLVAELNQRRVPTRSGVPWRPASVRRMLRNPAYIGTLAYGQMPQGRFTHVGDGGVGGDEMIVTENAFPALIDRRTFDKVQEKLRRRASPRDRSRSNDYILSGLLVCGVTGEKMWGRRTVHGAHLRYYSVRRPKNNGRADDCFSIRKDLLEAFVIGKVVDLLTQPDVEDRIRKAVKQRLQAVRAKKSDPKALRKRLADLDEKIAKGTERLLLVDADDLPAATRVLAEWRNDRRRVAEELERVDAASEGNVDAEVDAVMARLGDLRESFESADPAKLRAALRTVIDEITIFWGPGGPRRWRLERGVIRFGESLRVALPCMNKPIRTRRRPTARS